MSTDMSMQGAESGRRQLAYYAVVLVALGLLAAFAGVDSNRLNFKPVSGESIVDLLAPLFVIALFLERAQEVFITTWRKAGRTDLEDRNRNLLAAELPDSNAILASKQALARYKETTTRIAFLFGLSAGVLISIVGVRVLDPLTDFQSSAAGPTQAFVFKLLDIVLTGGLIGGGSDGIHKLVSVATDFLDKTREKITEPSPKP